MFDKIICCAKKVPHNYKIAFVSTYVLGLIAHMFCYTNTLLWHDSPFFYWNDASIQGTATAGRWFNAIIFNLMGNVVTPWLMGVLILFLYTIITWMTCEILNVQGDLSTILVAGLIVTNRTVTCMNLFISGTHTFTFALLFSVFAVYAYNHFKFGYLWSWISMFFCASVYVSYADFGIALFLVQQIFLILANRENIKKIISRHFIMLFVFFTSILASYFIDTLILKQDATAVAQERFNAVAETSGLAYTINIFQAIKTVLKWFAPNSHRSYFQDIKWFYAIFLVAVVFSFIIIIYSLLKKRCWKQPISILLLLVDGLCLLLAMNLIDIIVVAMDLHHFAYIIPWIFFVGLYCNIIKKQIDASVLMQNIYAIVVLIVSVCTIGMGIRIANTVYTKVYNEIEASIYLLNRIVDKVESTEGYIPGDTPVIIIGDTKRYYLKDDAKYDLVKDLDVVYSPWFDSALTYSVPIEGYIHQTLAIDMNIIDIKYGSAQTTIANSYEYAEYIKNTTGFQLDSSKLNEIVDSGNVFPSTDASGWCGDVLVIVI